MIKTYDFLKQVVDSLTESIAVLDSDGEILFVNQRWVEFGESNACSAIKKWTGMNYIEVCERASETGDEFGHLASEGIRQVIDNKKPVFYFEYPCHSPSEKRWFMMRVNPFSLDDETYYVISHQNITERKLAEEEIHNLAHIDSLTNIPNRRSFDEFLHNEWERCKQQNLSFSLAFIDIDHFKMLNDFYGHQTGDECLAKVGGILKMHANRSSDRCCRYGGDEFALVWGGTTQEQAEKLAGKILEKITALKIPNKNSYTANYLTVSLGIASVDPSSETELSSVIGLADNMLYEAKESGRNMIKSASACVPDSTNSG